MISGSAESLRRHCMQYKRNRNQCMIYNAHPLNKIFRRLLMFTIAAGLFFMPASGKTFYFSSTAGNDAYTAQQAQDAATPWRSLSKLNAVFSTLVPGDSILFKRGDVFYGNIIVSSSGLVQKYITLAAYGTGAMPVISGLTTLDSWTQDSSGIYSSAAVPVTRPNLVLINNRPQPMGRYPNESAGNGGYLRYQSFTDAPLPPSIADTQLTDAINWTGAEVVIRKKLWVIDRCRITRHSGSTIYFSNEDATDYGCTANYGYFIQNDIRTLDEFGEWYFDPLAGKFKIYFGTAMPAGYTVKVATVNNLVNVSTGKKFIAFRDIAFEGANTCGIFAESSGYIKVVNCSFTNIGETAVYIKNTSDVLIENSSTYNCLSNAFRLVCDNDSNVVIRNCNVKKTGALRGMGASGGNSYKGISVALTKSLLIENNVVDSTGYVGIEFDGSDVVVQKNWVSNFCFTKDDAGGIYSWVPVNAGVEAYYTNRVLKNNIVMNGIGAPDGRSSANAFVTGIYLDGHIMNVDVLDNTVFNVGKNGFHCNNPVNITIKGNTSYNNLNAVSFMRWPGAVISNLVMKNNIFYPKLITQRNLYYTNAALDESGASTVMGELRGYGTIDSNYHSSSNPSGFYYEVYASAGGALVPMSPQSFDAWKSSTGFDTRSKRPFREAPLYQVRNVIGNNLVINGSFSSNINGVTVFGANTFGAWDNTNKINGGSLRVSFTTPTANRYGLLYSTVGSVSNTKKYVLRFRTLGTTSVGIVRAYIRKTASPYNNLTPVQTGVFETTVKSHEFLFTAPVTESNASFVIEIEQNSGTTYVDDIEFYEADAAVFALDDYLRFEYNAGNSDRTISLGDNYVGVDATYYPGTITLKPFTSAILVKDTSILRAPLTVQVTSGTVNCYGDSAVVTVAASGGIPPYTGTGTFKVAAGSYSFIVKDLRGVAIVNTVTITQPAAPLRVTVNAGTITVYGGTVAVVVSATGGTAPYTGTGTFNSVQAGTYRYVVTDAKGCRDSVTITLTQPLPFRAFANAASVKCFGGSASVNITATGGIPPYFGTGQYSMPSGSYYFKVRDAVGNVATVTITVSQPLAPLKVTASAGTITSFGATTTVSIAASGGTAPYTGTGTISNVAAGTYTYSVTDAAGCVSTATITITQPPAVFTAVATSPGIKCYDGTAIASVTAGGGVAPYTSTGNYTVNAGKGSLRVSFPQTLPNNFSIVYYTIGSISSSKKYILRFSTLGTTASGNLKVYLRQTNSPWDTLTPRQSAAFGTARIDHQFIFTAPATEASASFVIQLGQGSGTTYIDNIAFFEADAGNRPISTNRYAFGDFENGIANIFTYSSNNNQVLGWDTTRKITRTWYFPVVDAAGNYAVAALATSQPAQLQVNAAVSTVVGGVASVTVTATGGTAPYTGTGVFSNIPLGTRIFSVTDANGCMAAKTVTVALTKPFVITDKDSVFSFDAAVYPNPSSQAFKLQITGTGAEKYAVSVFTAEGKLMYSRESRSLVYEFGENFAAGIYLVKVQQGRDVKTLKLIKTR